MHYKNYATGWTALRLWFDFRGDDRNTYTTESTLHWDPYCYLHIVHRGGGGTHFGGEGVKLNANSYSRG